MKFIKMEKTLKGKAGGKFKQRLKRSLALIMAVILMLSPMPGVSLVSRAERNHGGTVADFLTPDETLKENGGGYTTAWKVGGVIAGTGFDIEGIEDPNFMYPSDPTAPYTGDRDQGIETTHLHSGFQTYVQTYDPNNPLAVNQDEEKVPLTENGAVYDFPSKGIQVQMKLHPTWDKKYIQVDYLVHNTKETANQVQLGTSADIQLGKRGPDGSSTPGDPSDSSLLNVTSRGIHMTNGTSASFECMFHYHDLDLTMPDSIWVGDKADMDTNRYNSQDSTQGGDAAMSYSWTIDLAPGETVTKSVAYGAKGASYYVDPRSGSDNWDGTYKKPWRTPEKAISVINSNHGKFAYMYLQSNWTLSAQLNLNGNMAFEISSADYDRNGNPVDSIFSILLTTQTKIGTAVLQGNRLLRLGNLILEGNSRQDGGFLAPRYGGSLSLTSGTTLRNCYGSAGGSAIGIYDTANLDLNNVMITNCSGGYGAIYHSSSGRFTVGGKCTIVDNLDNSRKSANVFFDNRRSPSSITVTDNLKGSKIGVYTRTDMGPDISPDGNATNPSQEVVIAKPAPGSEVDQAPSPFLDVFYADKSDDGYYTAVGTANLTAQGDQNDKNTVLRKHGIGISFEVTTKDGSPIPNAPVLESQVFTYGQTVNLSAPPVIPGYTLYETQIAQADPPTLHAAAPGEANPGSITGTMPNQNVTVTYVYRELKTAITFDTNGGVTSDGGTELPALTGKAGDPTPPMPAVTKEGYVFKGWSKENNGPTSPIFSWPNVFPDEPDGLKLYAVFAPDSAKKYDYTIEYSNADDTIQFHTESHPDQYSVEDDVTAARITIPGYSWDNDLSETDPAGIGQFADSTGAYTGKMPAEPLTVHYGYRLDPTTTFPLTIRYESVNGAQLNPPSAPSFHAAEASVIADPLSIDHYTCVNYRFDQGITDGLTEAGYVKPVTSQPDSSHGFHWSAPMPNQPVTLTYLYAGDGAEDSRFSITERYEDAETQDPALREIQSPVRPQIPTDTPVDGTYTPPYGYLPVRPFAAPETTAPSGTNITFGTGADQDKWSGAMPAGDVTITYQNSRNPAKWADLTYKSGPHGTLTPTGIPDASPDPIPPASPDVQDNGDGTCKAAILISDGSPDGQANAYDFAAIKHKKLLPNPQPADPDYYRFREWLLDADATGTVTPEDIPCEDSRTFTGPVTLLASFEEIPDKWTDLHFKADKGTYTPSGKPETLHIRTGRTWGDITEELPSYDPWNSYTEEGSFWYREGDAAKTPMEPDTLLEKDATYIHQFVPSTNPEHTYTLTKIYKSTSGTVLKTDTEAGKHIDDPVTAAPLPPEELPGYRLKENGWSVFPESYQFIPGTDQQLKDYFDAAGNYSGPMPGGDLTLTYLYEPTGDTYTLKVQYLSANGVPLSAVPDRSYQADEPFTTQAKHFDGYTCSSVTIAQITDQPGVTQVQGTPSTDSDFTSRMPNQDVTVTYRYTGSQTDADRHTLTVTYIDTGSSDPLLKELPGGTAVTYYPDQAIAAGTLQPPAGYRKDPNPENAFTIDPPDRGIRFTDESQSDWTGFMPNEDVTITCYCERIPGDPAHPENNDWGDLTYLAGPNGSLRRDETVSPDVTGPDGEGRYMAAVLLEKAGTDAAYTWAEILAKRLVPFPEAAPYYEFAGWYIDTNKNGIIDDEDTLLAKDDGTDPPQTGGTAFSGPTALIASFTKAPGDWLTLKFAVAEETEEGKEGWNGGSLTDPDRQIELPSETKTWGDIKGEVAYTLWPGYVLDQVTASDGSTVEDSTLLKVSDSHTGPDPYTDTFTFHFKPGSDPQDAHPVQVRYTGRDSSGQDVIFGPEEEPQEKFVTDPVEADRKNVPGYDWIPGTSGTEPARYEFIPGSPENIGSFNPADGHFAGHMPLSALTVTYRYELRPDASFPVNVSYQLKTETGEPGPQIHEARPTEPHVPGDTVTVSPEPADGPIDGFLYDGYQLVKGDAKETEDQDPQLLNPVTGHPAEDGQWSFTMPNQEVSLIYLYKVDPTKTNKVTETYVETDPVTGQETNIIDPVTHRYPAGTEINGSYPELYGYIRVTPAMPVITGAEDWTGDAPIEVVSDGLTWHGTMIPKDLTVTYRYKRIQTSDPDHPDTDHPWGSLVYLPGRHGTVIRDANVSPAVTDCTYTVPGTEPPQTIQGCQASVLLGDSQTGSLNQPYTFGDIKNKQLIPTAKANPAQYYQWEGWFIDANHNGLRDAAEPLLKDTDRFQADSTQEARTLTASFAEIPGQWTDIHFKTEHAAFDTDGQDAGGQEEDHKLHLPKGRTWQDVIPYLPAVTPEVNYVYGGWYADKDDPAAGRPPMDGQTAILDGHTYTYVATKNPQIFGTNVETPEAQGSLDGQGKGRVTLYETREGDYQYLLTDMDGTIKKTAPKRARSETVEFDGLYPGYDYQVYEAGRQINAAPETSLPDLGLTEGTDISPAGTVRTPVLTDNYEIYYSDPSGEDTKTTLLIRPADPASDYAVLDKNGEAVPIPGAQEGGWITPAGSNTSGSAALQIPGLTYGEDYTVVARIKGQTGVNPIDRIDYGSVITAVPAGQPDLKSYIIATTLGEITQIQDPIAGELEAGSPEDDASGSDHPGFGSPETWDSEEGSPYTEDTPAASSYAAVHPGASITLYAPAANDNGEEFDHWEVTIGTLKGQELPEDNEITFTMPDCNLVMTPVYQHNAYPKANVTDEVRGGNKNEIALDPNEIPAMETTLTDYEKDNALITENKADVTYKLVYKKGKLRQGETAAVKDSGEYEMDHEAAYHAAWALDVFLERYVDGRKVPIATSSDAAADTAAASNPASADGTNPAVPADPSNPASADSTTTATATPSDAAAEIVQFNGPAPSCLTYVQMGKDDLDMLDYQLYKINPDGTAEQVPLLRVSGDADSAGDIPEQSGGLFAFRAEVGSRYVMVYNRAYHLYFSNHLPPLGANDEYGFKVRQNEYQEYRGCYDEQKAGIPEIPASQIARSGAEYKFQGWSYSPDNANRLYDITRPIKNTTHVYAVYSDNEAEVARERLLLDQAIQEAEKLSRDPFLKRQDSEALKQDIEEALQVLSKEDPHRSVEEELREARENLERQLKRYQEQLKATQNQYDEIQNHNSGGGSSGGGGGGSGSKADPYNATPNRNYTVGTNGSWVKVNEDVSHPGRQNQSAQANQGDQTAQGDQATQASQPAQPTQWAFVLNGGMRLRSMWAYLSYPESGNAAAGWYHFNTNAIMDTGWYTDEAGKWHYSYRLGEGPEGKMATGWRQDTADTNWYYLDPSSGAMTTGWRQIGGKWYYFEPIGMNTYDASTGQWTYGGAGSAAHPLGSMYKNETTPDGYPVDASGARIQ